MLNWGTMVHTVKGRWVKLGRQIKGCRERAGISQRELARRVALSPTMFSAMERGARGIKREHLERIDKALGTGGVLADAWDRSSDSGLPEWYQDGAERERMAFEIREYHPLVVPGLLQTEEYARALLRVGLPHSTPAEIEDLVRGRMDRQTLLTSDRPPRLLVVVDEGVLRRPLGGRGIMKRQIARLLEASDEQHISIQVVPYDTEHHPGLSNAFILYEISNRGSVLYVETRGTGMATDDTERVSDHMRLFGDLLGVALPPAASRKLIEQIQGEFS
ncbi:transcriptional regulator with XRE-family HTH domain [Thermobifida halotolerans]